MVLGQYGTEREKGVERKRKIENEEREKRKKKEKEDGGLCRHSLMEIEDLIGKNGTVVNDKEALTRRQKGVGHEKSEG